MLDPAEFLELESIESSRKTIPRYRGTERRRGRDRNRPPAEGSTYFPKFPAVSLDKGFTSPTRMFALDDVKKMRKEINKKYSKRSPERMKKDYNKTKQDFYRMELDKLNEMRPTYNRPSMVNTYNAYLQNTPGSQQALNDCIKGMEARLLKDQANVSLLPKHPGRQSRAQKTSRRVSSKVSRQKTMDQIHMEPSIPYDQRSLVVPNSAG
ncbi:hypothetical protein FSP39_004739 [Pinctada imbricata]|uniref:Uncharacterized protein n=1 Tax=Pinctada imbricata TaxID=66713 RepID=A0AA89BU12_PINIB|nr:hypothetical protein FSP39_004739 [Pinctada imbricata]